MGLGVFEYCTVAEELARAWMSSAGILARAQGLRTAVADPARRAELLRRSARGEWIGAIALSEPDAGSDLAGVSARAVLDGDEWVVTGHKRWCGDAGAADFIQVLVRERDPGPGESRSAGLVDLPQEKERGSSPPGLTGTPIDEIGHHGFLTWGLVFDGVRIPRVDVVDETAASDEQGEAARRGVRRGAAVARHRAGAHRRPRGRPGPGGPRGLDRPPAGARAVRPSDRRPPGPALRRRRDGRADRAGRASYRQVAHLVDSGVRCDRQAAMVELEVTEMAVRVTDQAVQLHGGSGYTTERQVERHWRDARLTTIFEGTSEIQERIVSDRLPRSPLTQDPGVSRPGPPARRRARCARAPARSARGSRPSRRRRTRTGR